MSPKEKANSLVNSFRTFAFSENGKWDSSTYNSKQCALIAVEEILTTLQIADIDYDLCLPIDYWNDVKNEIELL
jgi:hypothetical protein